VTSQTVPRSDAWDGRFWSYGSASLGDLSLFVPESQDS